LLSFLGKTHPSPFPEKPSGKKGTGERIKKHTPIRNQPNRGKKRPNIFTTPPGGEKKEGSTTTISRGNGTEGEGEISSRIVFNERKERKAGLPFFGRGGGYVKRDGKANAPRQRKWRNIFSITGGAFLRKMKRQMGEGGEKSHRQREGRRTISSPTLPSVKKNEKVPCLPFERQKKRGEGE